jgi:hypothetical protein
MLYDFDKAVGRVVILKGPELERAGCKRDDLVRVNPYGSNTQNFQKGESRVKFY